MRKKAAVSYLSSVTHLSTVTHLPSTTHMSAVLLILDAGENENKQILREDTAGKKKGLRKEKKIRKKKRKWGGVRETEKEKKGEKRDKQRRVNIKPQRKMSFLSMDRSDETENY